MGYIKAVESLTVILVPLTPVIPLCTGRFGHAGAAVVCTALMALSWLAMVDVTSMKELYVMVGQLSLVDYEKISFCRRPTSRNFPPALPSSLALQFYLVLASTNCP